MILKVACIQTNAQADTNHNLGVLEQAVQEAAPSGARIIFLPENTVCMITGRDQQMAHSFDETAHPAIPFFKDMAAKTGCWLSVGSLWIKADEGHIYNRSYLFDDKGTIAARYDKIHLFDADVAGDRVYRESDTFRAGDRAVLAPTPWGPLGMSVCYDVRFPHLYRSLATAGAVILSVPAAFTYYTGEMHWHTLLRARAIENGCYVVAAAQCGTHDGGRRTYGHSLIVDPMGRVVADGGDTPGIVLADINLDLVTEARHRIPSLKNGRVFRGP